MKPISHVVYFLGCITGYDDINGTIHYSLAEDTTKFIQKKMTFDACIFNATGVRFFVKVNTLCFLIY